MSHEHCGIINTWPWYEDGGNAVGVCEQDPNYLCLHTNCDTHTFFGDDYITSQHFMFGRPGRNILNVLPKLPMLYSPNSACCARMILNYAQLGTLKTAKTS